jgi:hypothetical protein
VTDWVKTDEVIFSANAASGSHTPDVESFKLQWRNKSDSGTFADLVTGSGELRAGTSAGCITHFTNALDGKEYAFQLYSVTTSSALGEFTPTITTYIEPSAEQVIVTTMT